MIVFLASNGEYPKRWKFHLDMDDENRVPSGERQQFAITGIVQDFSGPFSIANC